jgi:uncharacterized membrane protein
VIEIIPNVHPIFVHFTVALFSTAVGFYTLSYLLPKLRIFPKLSSEFEIVARWCLWAVGIIVIATVFAGLYAFNTVNHDGPSHLAMTDHRNWAIPTACAMVLVALWSLWRTYKRKTITITFILVLFIVQGLLLSTAWRGAELVFRYGLGVMSLPKAEGEGHNHMEGMKENPMGSMDSSTMPSMEKNDGHSNHKHAE